VERCREKKGIFFAEAKNEILSLCADGKNKSSKGMDCSATEIG